MPTLADLRERGFSNPTRVIHNLCGHIVFFTDGVPAKPGILNPNKVILFNGGTPRNGDPIVCPGCALEIHKNHLTWVIADE